MTQLPDPTPQEILDDATRKLRNATILLIVAVVCLLIAIWLQL